MFRNYFKILIKQTYSIPLLFKYAKLAPRSVEKYWIGKKRLEHLKCVVFT